MQIVAVDDEPLMLEKIKRSIEEAEPTSQLYIFEKPKDVLSFAKTHKVDVFFLDVRMSGMDGVTLAKKIKLIQHRANIIFSTEMCIRDSSITAGSLSGGNQQKVVVAREVDMGDKLIIIDQPTRGLDIGAINYVHKTILNEKAKGKSILLVSTELSEIFALSDRIAVLYKGKIMGIYKNGQLTTDKIGLLMAGYEIENLEGKEGGNVE